MAQITITERATRREWIGLCVLALPCLLATMDMTVLYLAGPHLSQDLKPSSAQMLWIMDIYGFLIAGSLITMGTLGDRIGRRKLLLIGAAAFGSASILAAFSQTAEQLIAARALLGIAGATLAPSTLSLIRNMFLDPRERMLAITIWATSFSIGAAIGPLLGGFLLQYFWWGSVFLVGVPVMVLLLIAGPMLLPEFRDPSAGRLDLASAALSLTAVLSIIYGLKRLAESGPGSLPFATIALGLILGTLFVRRQRSLVHPFIDLGLFRNVAFSTALGTNTLVVFAAFAVFFYISQYLQLVLGLSPLQAGLWSLPCSVSIIVGNLLTPLALRYVRPAYVMAGGLFVTGVGLLIVAQVDAQSGLTTLLFGAVLYHLGFGPVPTIATDLVIGNAPPERAGAAAAISETSAELGGALGIAVLGSLGTLVYRSRVVNAIPSEVSAEGSELARATLGGAVAAAQSLSEPLATALLGPAREAFSASLRLTAAIGCALSFGLAILVAVVLREMRSHSA